MLYQATVSVSVGFITEQVRVADLPDCTASPSVLKIVRENRCLANGMWVYAVGMRM